MEKKIINKFLLFSLLFFFMTAATIFQSIHQDYTSIHDWDLVVIHNSLQLVSNKFPDYQDLTAYSHFLTYGIFYKVFSFFDYHLISNIDLLMKVENPEVFLQKLYIISRIANSTIHFVTIVFIYGLLSIFKIDEYYKIITILFIIFSKTFLANFIILRSDIVAVCFFFISTYFLLRFVKIPKFINLFFVSLFMIFALLAKVQIIFLYMFLFFFFIFYSSYEEKSEILENDFFLSRIFRINLKYVLLIIILLYFVFQIYLNNFVNSSTGVGYLDVFCFFIYFLIMYITIFYMCRLKNITNQYLYNIFTVIISLSIVCVLFLKVLSIIGFIKIDFNIIMSITNPFYFLKSYSPFSSQEFSANMISNIFIVLFKDFNFNLIYSFLLLIVVLLSFYKTVLNFKEKKFNHHYIYIFLLSVNIIFLIAITNIRNNVYYNIYIIPFFFLLLGIYFNSIKKQSKLIFSATISIFIIFNFISNLTIYQSYIYKPSQLHVLCVYKPMRDFNYFWAKNFDEDFFKKICLNKNLLFK